MSWGSSLSGKLPTGHRCPGGFREILGTLRDVSCTVMACLKCWVLAALDFRRQGCKI